MDLVHVNIHQDFYLSYTLFTICFVDFFFADIEIENCNLLELDKNTRAIIEADSFWCTSRLLDGIQDNYTFAQPGIQMKVNALRELIKRIDGKCYVP